MALRHTSADFLFELCQPVGLDRLPPVSSGGASPSSSMLNSLLSGKPASTSAASVVSSAFSAAAKSAPRSVNSESGAIGCQPWLAF